MIAGALRAREADEALRAAELIKQKLSIFRQRVFFGRCQQRRTTDQFRAAMHCELFRGTEVVTQIVDAVHPKSALNDAPAQHEVGVDELPRAVHYRRVEFAKIVCLFWAG